jgi:hypothetical protein
MVARTVPRAQVDQYLGRDDPLVPILHGIQILRG